MSGDLFIGLMICLQVCATVAYLLQDRPTEALLWFAYAVSNAAYLALHRG